MKRTDAGRPRSRVEHESPAGMQVQAEWTITAIDINGLAVPELGISIVLTGSNAYGVSGAIGNETLCHEVLDNAIDAVKACHQRKTGIAVPGKDVSITGYQLRQLNVIGPIENREFAVAVLANAKTIVSNMHTKRRATNGAARIEL